MFAPEKLPQAHLGVAYQIVQAPPLGNGLVSVRAVTPRAVRLSRWGFDCVLCCVRASLVESQAFGSYLSRAAA